MIDEQIASSSIKFPVEDDIVVEVHGGEWSVTEFQGVSKQPIVLKRTNDTGRVVMESRMTAQEALNLGHYLIRHAEKYIP